MPIEATCGDVLELEGFEGSILRLVFVCTRPAGHSLVHIDNSRGRAAGVPAWTMVWTNADAPAHVEPLEVPRW